jgi:hypothetical protein
VTTEKADADAAKPDHTNAAETKNAEDALSGLDAVGLGKGWDTIAELKLPAGESAGASGASGDLSLLNSFGKQVNGDFGSGTFVSTRVINALITDSGKVYIGAVSQDALIKAANK